ncbi:MAG: hypothetical protein WB439_11285 [Acidobacteriaceae bacterium]
MDRVRFGRALGYGARHAAKTLMQAADAATTPGAAGPAIKAASAPQVQQARPRPAVVTERVAQTGRTAAAATKHAGKLGRSIWTPLARFSGVVWLQVTGLFFALIAMFMFQGAWKDRAALHLPFASPRGREFWGLAAAFVVFAYFTVSNFVRAYLKDRR